MRRLGGERVNSSTPELTMAFHEGLKIWTDNLKEKAKTLLESRVCESATEIVGHMLYTQFIMVNTKVLPDYLCE